MRVAAQFPARPLWKDDSRDAVVQALQACLEPLESEILRLVKLASETDDTHRQQQYWEFAKDLQTEARLIRAELHAHRVSADRRRWWNRFLPCRKG